MSLGASMFGRVRDILLHTMSTTHTACKTCDYLAQATALSDQCTRLSFGLVVHGCLQPGLSLYEAKRIILNCDHIFVCTDNRMVATFSAVKARRWSSSWSRS